MATPQKSCVICGGEESEGELLIQAPCGSHFVCPDDVASFFERATDNESLFPPKCCGQIFMLQQYEEYVPFDVQWAYQVKEQGEYATLAKFRVYCGAPSCNEFLHPSTHITDPDTKLTYAICEDGACSKATCTGCKMLLAEGVQNHDCKKDEEEEKFRQTAKEKGYQQCTVCGATVELMEACNHISCDCGNDFCYICGKDWPGLHGCPHYGPAVYDEEGYNQEGYHRDTGLNRQGLTRRQEIVRRRGEDGDDDDFDEEDDGEDDPDWEVLQHLQPEQRVMIDTLRGDDREDALDQLRIELFEQQGIMFGQDPPPPPPQHQGAEQDEETDEEDDEFVGDEDEPETFEDDIDDPEDGDGSQASAAEQHDDADRELGLNNGDEELNEGGGDDNMVPETEPLQIQAQAEQLPDQVTEVAREHVDEVDAREPSAAPGGDLVGVPDPGADRVLITIDAGAAYLSDPAPFFRVEGMRGIPLDDGASDVPDFGAPRAEHASLSPPSGPATAGPTTPTSFAAHDAMDVDEPAESGAKITTTSSLGLPGGWPQDDDEEL